MRRTILAVMLCCVGLITACGSKERKKAPQGATEVMNNNTTASVENTSDEEMMSVESATEEPETTTEEIIPVWQREEYSYLIKPGHDNILHYDVDNDGDDEVITLYAEEPIYFDEFPKTMLRITDGERVLFQTGVLLTGSYYEQRSFMYYMVREKGKNYLLEFDCITYQGEDIRSYRLLEFSADGSMKEVESAESNLSVSGHVLNNTTDVDDAVKYYEKAMGYLERKDTILLFDLDVNFEDMVYSSDGDIRYADSRIEENLFEHTISESGFNALLIEWNENDTFRERVKKYCDERIAMMHFDD